MEHPNVERKTSMDDREIPKVLARNSACHQCRKRKLKCDAVRPICTNCSKPRPRINPNGDLKCTWDDKPSGPSDQKSAAGPSRTKKRKEEEEGGPKRARLQELEERVAAFEKQLKERQQVTEQSQSTDIPVLNNGEDRSSRKTSASVAEVPALSSFDMWNGADDELSRGFVNFAAIPPAGPPHWTPSVQADPATSMPDLPYSDSNAIDNVFDLIWPDWPQDLPSLEIVEHVVNVFFEKVPTAPKMLHRPTFLNSLQLPPSNPNFPARALLHAILGLTAPHLSPTSLATRAYFPVGASFSDIVHPEHDFTPQGASYRNLSGAFHFQASGIASPTSPMGRFQMWHRRKALQSMAIEFDAGQKLLQAVQAQVVVTLIDAYNAWWTDLWMEAGACTRMAIPLLINESSNLREDSLPRHKHVLIPPAQTPLEQACRDRTWWMVYLVERSVNMSTGWAESLHHSEITVEMPVAQVLFDRGIGDLKGIQTFQTPDLFASHPDVHADGFNLYIKALKLWTDVSMFFRSYGRGSHSIAGYLAHPSLRLFLSQINAFRLSIPSHLRRPTQTASTGTIDGELITAIMVTHAITLTLVEPLITVDLYQTDIAKMGLSAIRAVLSILYDITSTSYDLTRLSYACSFIWFSCAKGLCRMIDATTLSGDVVAASVYRAECDVFRMAIQQQGERYPISNRHLQMLDELIKLQAESTRDSDLQAAASCTPEVLFDPRWRPSADPVMRTSSASVSVLTPPEGSIDSPSQSSMPSVYRSKMAGFAPTHPSGAPPNPSIQWWSDEFPSANPNKNISAQATPSRPSQSPVGVKPAGHNSVDLGTSRPSSAGHQTWNSVTPESSAPAAQPVQQNDPQAQIDAILGSTTASTSATSTAQFSFEGMSVDQWFDISNLTFDPDTLAALVEVAQSSGMTFNPADYTTTV